MVNPTLPIPTSFEQITIPCKSTSEADWNLQLRTSISKLGEDPASFQSECEQFHRMRQDLRGAPSTMGGVEIIVNYYRQLEALMRRIDVSENPLTINFLWFDAYDTEYSIKQSSVAFEKANVLFNLGAMLTRIKSSGDSARHLQFAASVFLFIADNFLHPPLTDITRPVLLFLVSLMLAQAQELVTIKAIQENKSPSTISRLASSTWNFYHESQTRLDSGELADFRDHFDNFDNTKFEISALISCKESSWSAIREFCSGIVAYNDSRIGESICRFRTVAEMLSSKQCKSLNGTDLMKYVIELENLSNSIVAGLEKENNVIYNQPIPLASSLVQPEGAPLAKTTGISEVFNLAKESPDLFRKLLPLQIHEEASKYSEEKSKLLRYESMKITNADNDLQTTLSSLGFPAIMDSVSNFVNNSNGMIASPEKTRLNGEIDGKTRIFEDIQKKLELVSLCIEKSIDKLDSEIKYYQKMKLAHGDQWRQRPSHVGNSELYQDLSKLQQEHAGLKTSLDAIVLSFNASVSANRRLLSTDVAKKRPGSEFELMLKDLCEQLCNLEKLCKQRSLGLESLRQAILEDDIGDSICNSKLQNTSELFVQELSKFDNHCQNIEDNIETHNSLLSTFSKDWQKFIVESGWKDAEFEAKAHIKELAQALRNLEEFGRKFKKAIEISDQVEAFSQSRSAECKKLNDEISMSSHREGQNYLIEKLSSRQRKLPEASLDSSVLDVANAIDTTLKIGAQTSSNSSRDAALSSRTVTDTNEPSLLD